jgi:hypothetical protein
MVNQNQIAKRDRLVAYLRQHQSLIPQTRPMPWLNEGVIPSAQNYADAFLRDAEFLALGLGSFLSTPDGEVIASAAGLVIAPAHAPEYQTLVEALTLAAQFQREGQLGRAKKVGGLGVVVALIGLIVHHGKAAYETNDSTSRPGFYMSFSL